MSVVAVVLNWRRPDETVACVRSIHEAAPEVEVIVVDNASGDGSAAAIRDALPGVRLIENEANLGYAGGNNVGVRAALERRPEGVLVLNNDVILRPGCIDELLRALRRSRREVIFAPVSLDARDPSIVDFYRARVDVRNMALNAYGRGEPWWGATEPERSDYATGSALLVRASYIRDRRPAGLFDERFFLVWEDVDLCLQAEFDVEARAVVVPTAEVLHAGSVSFGADPGASPLYQYFFVRNSFLIARKHLRWPWRARTIARIERRYRGWAERSAEPVKRAMLLGVEHGMHGRYGAPPAELMPSGSRSPHP